MAETRVHEVKVDAAADDVYRLLVDLGNWPWVFKSFVHAEVIGVQGEFERCGMWTTSGDRVERWVALRRTDAKALRIDFRPEEPAPPLTSMQRAWVVEPVSDKECLVRLEHSYQVAGHDAEALAATGAVIDTIAGAETEAVKVAAELDADLRVVVVDRVTVDGGHAAVYGVLHDITAWPELLPHVVRVDALQDEDGLQLVEVDTVEADGGLLAMRTARVGLPDHLVAYKQLVLPPVGSSHSVRWRIESTEDAVTVTSEQTVVLTPGGRDLTEVTAFVRRELSAKVRLVLDRAKEVVEAS
ncbi:SRPBCC family protein [Streptomyces sp. CA-210063]|uniref:aromatase/cyclase n=1 Tax=Streptomyces sp. CA-210063 TaxID=2801029 RepID=UPI00214BFFFD|nr:SRPBCC family protein [Streptomyces sp. CA-210063]UUU30230.1 SRPBCC family protein [Streptomyces sp. CA-210063]